MPLLPSFKAAQKTNLGSSLSKVVDLVNRNAESRNKSLLKRLFIQDNLIENPQVHLPKNRALDSFPCTPLF